MYKTSEKVLPLSLKPIGWHPKNDQQTCALGYNWIHLHHKSEFTDRSLILRELCWTDSVHLGFWLLFNI